MYDNLVIEEICDKEKFSRYLKIHQKGQSDYYTFCKNCAAERCCTVFSLFLKDRDVAEEFIRLHKSSIIFNEGCTELGIK